MQISLILEKKKIKLHDMKKFNEMTEVTTRGSYCIINPLPLIAKTRLQAKLLDIILLQPATHLFCHFFTVMCLHAQICNNSGNPSQLNCRNWCYFQSINHYKIITTTNQIRALGMSQSPALWDQCVCCVCNKFKSVCVHKAVLWGKLFPEYSYTVNVTKHLFTDVCNNIIE